MKTFAACRNLAISLLRRGHVPNIAAGLRTCTWHPRLALRLVLTGPFET